MTTDLTRRGSIPGAMAWMIGLSILFAWLPIFGGLIAGYVGGSKAGSVGRAVAAVFLPMAIMWGTIFIFGPILGSIPIIGAIFIKIAELGAFAVSTMHMIPLLIGAIVGGKAAER